MKIKNFVFNPFQVNTFLLYDEQGDCVIIDPACYEKHEQVVISDFIKNKGLNLKMILNTHCHIDHILGNNFFVEKYNVPLKTHRDSVFFIESAKSYADTFGFEIEDQVKPDEYLNDKDIIEFGKLNIKVILAPGHADGSLCFYNEDQRILFSGDVLFNGGIGRTDLPTGDYETILNSIKDKLLVLPDDVTVYPGHGPATTIKEEKNNNPFVI